MFRRCESAEKMCRSWLKCFCASSRNMKAMRHTRANASPVTVCGGCSFTTGRETCVKSKTMLNAPSFFQRKNPSKSEVCPSRYLRQVNQPQFPNQFLCQQALPRGSENDYC